MAILGAVQGFPDASNTGVKAGTVLTPYSGTLRITQDNAVISGLDIRGNIIIDADNVTIVNCKITSTTPWMAVRVLDSSNGFKMTDCEIDGRGTTHDGVLGYGTFLRNEMYGVENGINITGPSLIQDNYIHGLAGGSEAHLDGIENNGASNVQIIHNTIVNDHSSVAAVMLNNEFGPLSNITIQNNQLIGGGYTVYLDGRKSGAAVDDASIKIINNRIGGGYWGDFAFYNDRPIVSGNVDADSDTIPPPIDPTPPPSEPPPAPPPPNNQTFMGTSGNDTFPANGQSNAGNELFYGLAGNDILAGGGGGDRIDGGTGTDTSTYAGSTAAVRVDLQAGTSSGGYATGDTILSIENLAGSSWNDWLGGNTEANVLNGGAGADTMRGLGGNDVYVIDNAADIVDESAAGSSGTDTVQSTISFSLANTARVLGSVENLTLLGSANIDATGNALNNGLTGNSGNNILDGGAGADRMRGGAGNDIYYVDNAGDIVDEGEAGSNGSDTVRSTITFSLADTAHVLGSVGDLTLLGSANINGTGNSLDNLLIGNSGANVLTGAADNDVMNGGAGNDTMNGGSENDRLNGEAGNDVLTGGSGSDTFLFTTALSATSNVDRITDFNAAADTIQLENLVFTSLTSTGTLSRGAFYAGAAAHDSTDRVIYNPATGALTYDSNGDALGGATQFATLSAGLTLTAADFVVV